MSEDLARVIKANETVIAHIVDLLTRSIVRVVPFVGAGLSVDFGFPTWRAFLIDAAGDGRRRVAREARVLLRKGDFEGAAQALTQADPAAFEQMIRSHFAREPELGEVETTAVWRVPILARGGPVVTTNFDRVLERVFSRRGAPFEDVAHGPDRDLFTQAMVDGRSHLLMLHGRAASAQGRVLTATQYTEAYDRAGVPSDPNRVNALPDLLHTVYATTHLLFLGSSLSDTRTLEILRRAARDRGPDFVHFSVLTRPRDREDHRRLEQTLSECHVRPIWIAAGRYDLIPLLLDHVIERAGLRAPGALATSRRLTGPDDSLLQHGRQFRGRENDVEKVLEFLHGASGLAEVVAVATTLASVEGAPGIGKSAVCKEALSRWLAAKTGSRAFWVDITEARRESDLIDRLGVTLGLGDAPSRADVVAAVDTLDGVLYLDNLEDALDDAASSSWSASLAARAVPACWCRRDAPLAVTRR